MTCCFESCGWYQNFKYPEWAVKVSEKIWDEDIILKVAAAVLVVFLALGTTALIIHSSPLLTGAFIFIMAASGLLAFTNYIRNLQDNGQEARS